jgi:DNA integrity scanning protein DisA with diadenylate cyclase activity
MMENLMALPPVFAASALYDNLLQSALRQFFGRATFETEPIPSLSSDGRLAIEPTNDPSVLSIRWFGSRHVLHVPARRPFTPHEVRLAKAIGSVLALRYRAIFDPRQMLERGDLFRGAIEDRYVSAFLNAQEQNEAALARADLVATALEILRVAALSSYENKSISSGVLLVDDDERVRTGGAVSAGHGYKYSAALTGIKSFYRLSDGVETLFLVNREATVLDIVEIERYVKTTNRADPVLLDVPCPTPYRHHAMATSNNRNICVVLTPSHEIKVFGQGVEIFSFRNARWHLLDVQAKYEMWERAVENEALASRLFQAALDLSDARQGALFVVLRDAATSLPLLVAPGDRLDAARAKPADAPDRVQLLHMLRGRSAVSLDPAVLAGLAKTDGATVMDPSGRLLAVGAILMHTEPLEPHSTLAVEGARTTAAMAAGRYAAVLKVSEDGLITFYDRQEKIWDI